MKNRIRELREERHMTQVRLSIELGVSQETVSAYEKQKHYPSYTQLVKMSELFHTSVDYLMGRSDIRMPMKPCDNDFEKLFRLVKQLSSCQLELAYAYIQGMVDLSTRQEQVQNQNSKDS